MRCDEFLIAMHDAPSLCSHREGGDPLSQAGGKFLFFFLPLNALNGEFTEVV